MSNFLTVEDVNGANLNHVNDYYTLDTADISTSEFSNVKYDFIVVSHSINNDEHTFTFEIHNTLWNGFYWFEKGNGDYINSDGSYSDNILTFTTTESSVKLNLYLCSFQPSFEFKRILLKLIDTDTTISTINQAGQLFQYSGMDLESKESVSLEINNFNLGVNECNKDNILFGYLLNLLRKTDLVFNLNSNVTVGKINKVKLNVDSHYLPGGDLVGEDELNISIRYEDNLIDAYFDETINDYCFDLNLTDKRNTDNISLDVIVFENDYVNQGNFEFRLGCQYLQVGNFGDLINEIIVNGAEIIELSDDITLLSRISVNHDLIIYGNNHSIDLNSCGFNIMESNVFKAENISFNNGDTSIIQSLNTKVELTNCIFSNCESSNYNNLGSVIYCDVDIESLSDGNDFITTLTNCEFYDNHNCIFSGGELNILDCKLHNIDTDYLEINNPALVYQTDGSCTINGSVFDIDYTSDALCSEEINIGFAQALIRCGQSALINGVLGSNLAKDDTLPFFDGLFNNRSHVFAKYYYPQIGECVYTSPVLNMEDKNICYEVSGLDWVFKENIQVTRSSQNMQNENRKIIWED